MSTAIAGKKLSTKPAEPDDRQRARQSKRHPDCRSTTIKLTAHANIACVIVGPRQSSSRPDRRKGHPDCRRVPIQIVALQRPEVCEDAGISGAKGRDKRPGLEAMMKALNAKEFDIVAAWSVDRLGRSLTDLLGSSKS